MGFLLCMSCNNFEFKKISTERFFEEELKSINWNEVDVYPGFKNCEAVIKKVQQKTCFQKTLTSSFYKYLQEKTPKVNQAINDTVFLSLSISNVGQINLTKIEGDALIFDLIPKLKQWLQESVKQLPKASPASKRGIPVATQFKLPIIIKIN